MDEQAEGWMAVAQAADVPADGAVRVSVGELDVLLVRAGEALFALDDRCSHQGGLLHRGRVDRAISPPTVTCPIHGSMFLLTDGRVLRGPSVRPQPVFDVRERDGAIEIRDRAG